MTDNDPCKRTTKATKANTQTESTKTAVTYTYVKRKTTCIILRKYGHKNRLNILRLYEYS